MVRTAVGDELGQALRELHYLRRTIDEHAIVSMADATGNITYVNDKFCEISQYHRDELIGNNHRILNSGFHSREMFAGMWSDISSGKTWQGELRNRRKDGSHYWVETTIVPFLDEAGLPYQYVSVRTEITHVKESEIALRASAESLRRAKEAAEKANAAKSLFLSRMSHELRTPMNAILGFAQLMQNDHSEPLSPSQRDSVQHILKSGWHLLELINDVLDYARIESGGLQLKMDSIEIAPVVRECLEMIEPLARERGIRLRDEVTPCMPHWVRADRLRLRQILLNLMSNAIKYNKEDGEIVLACASNQAWVRINVTDSGCGIAPQHIEKMFEPFNRLDANAHLIPGTGIGLAISKQLVELMGGQMGVESELGRGSNFWLDMAVASPASVGQETPVAEQLPEQGRQARMPADCCVLYIEDNPANVLLMEKIFAQHYPQVRLETAGNAEMGLIMAYNLRPALILLDIGLPGMSGHQVIETLHANEVMRDIPVVAVSAYTSRSEVRRGMAEGFFEYITKPIDVKHFIRVIDAALQKQQPSS